MSQADAVSPSPLAPGVTEAALARALMRNGARPG